ncbi:hypothetical protein ACSBR2_028239 [Camellia fascicularis]
MQFSLFYGCMIQYALRASSGLDSAAVVSGLVSSYDSAPESDARLLVEAIQKWNICQKQSRRDREDNSDIYGENGYSDSSKIFPEVIKRENSGYLEARGSVGKVKISPEERHHLFISEAELQMHQPRIPLWAKPEIYFQSMTMNDIKIDVDDACGGEIEIERIPTRMIEARSKDLVPVFDYLQTPKFQQARTPASASNTNNGCPLRQTSGLSENGRLSCSSGSSSLDSFTDGGVAVTEFHRAIEETRWGGCAATTILLSRKVALAVLILWVLGVEEGGSE